MNERSCKNCTRQNPRECSGTPYNICRVWTDEPYNWENSKRRETKAKTEMNEEKEKTIARYLIQEIWKNLKKREPNLKSIDSNVFHFIIYSIAEKCKLSLTRGWFYWGGYVPAVDDVLVEDGMMEKKYHQMGNHPDRFTFAPMEIEKCVNTMKHQQ